MLSILKLQTLTMSTLVPGLDDSPFMSSTSAVCSGASVQCPVERQLFSME
jgi:hypothetical protein